VIEGPSFNKLTLGRAPSNYANAWKGNPHSFAVRGSHGHVERVRRNARVAANLRVRRRDQAVHGDRPFSGTATVRRGRVSLGRDFRAST
jgi:hypothetical protein